MIVISIIVTILCAKTPTVINVICSISAGCTMFFNLIIGIIFASIWLFLVTLIYSYKNVKSKAWIICEKYKPFNNVMVNQIDSILSNSLKIEQQTPQRLDQTPQRLDQTHQRLDQTPQRLDQEHRTADQYPECTLSTVIDIENPVYGVR